MQKMSPCVALVQERPSVNNAFDAANAPRSFTAWDEGMAGVDAWKSTNALAMPMPFSVGLKTIRFRGESARVLHAYVLGWHLGQLLMMDTRIRRCRVMESIWLG